MSGNAPRKPGRRPVQKAAGKRAAPSAPEVREVSKAFGGQAALDHVSVRVPAGSAVGVVGPNGAGKTTLLRCVVGIEVPDSGAVLFDREKRAETDPRFRADVAVLVDDLDDLDDLDVFGDLSVLEHLDLLACAHGVPDARAVVDAPIDRGSFLASRYLVVVAGGAVAGAAVGGAALPVGLTADLPGAVGLVVSAAAVGVLLADLRRMLRACSALATAVALLVVPYLASVVVPPRVVPIAQLLGATPAAGGLAEGLRAVYGGSMVDTGVGLGPLPVGMLVELSRGPLLFVVLAGVQLLAG